MTGKNKPKSKARIKGSYVQAVAEAESLPDTTGMPTHSARCELQAECGEIPYAELQKFFAKGMLVNVDTDLDLVDVAMAMAQDDADTLQKWTKAGLVQRAHDEHARSWLERQSILKAVTVTPWILVQETEKDKD